ncbi:MAG: c-5 sterol desaturase [Ramalina farinacea]|uniref:C-5 sterol desaturase n=1 Tax=Ramalina farinacea TaxID=258253 RepID=A0AA43TXD7_9LECA|nr:c-5 sterol desaturase [Ramalina farinacea]
MDVALELLDPFMLDKAYASFSHNPHISVSNSSYSTLPVADRAIAPSWPRDNIYRQIISILCITQFGATSLYFVFSALSYYFVFDRRLEYHPRFLQNQVRQEIRSSLWALPFINLFTLPLFLAEVRGKSLLYADVSDHGWPWLVFSSIAYMAFNDFSIYWIHRLEHHPSVYKYIHKPHHKWIGKPRLISLPPRSLPFSLFVFICPMQRYLYMVLFIAVQIWTILIHDGDMITGHWTEKFINSPAHHTLHHMYFTVNYGQYFTWADTFFGSHRAPQPALDPLHDALKVMRAKGLVDEQGHVIQKPKGE